MDAVLATHSETCAFAMRDVELFAGARGGMCNLQLISTLFSASTRFTFDYPSLPDFIQHLAALEQRLEGEARLGQQFEEPFVLFRGDGLGHITVSGVLVDYGDQSQRLEFEFTTDQTALGPFIQTLRDVIAAHAAA